MTRINLVDPGTLHQKHLVAEYREIVRVFALARGAQYEMHRKRIPSEYTLCIGHVLFFYDKLKWVSNRYDLLCAEMLRRGFNCNRIPQKHLHSGIELNMFRDYVPTERAVALNVARIADRMPK